MLTIAFVDFLGLHRGALHYACYLNLRTLELIVVHTDSNSTSEPLLCSMLCARLQLGKLGRSRAVRLDDRAHFFSILLVPQGKFHMV